MRELIIVPSRKVCGWAGGGCGQRDTGPYIYKYIYILYIYVLFTVMLGRVRGRWVWRVGVPRGGLRFHGILLLAVYELVWYTSNVNLFKMFS